jgi:hypothetical protein
MVAMAAPMGLRRIALLAFVLLVIGAGTAQAEPGLQSSLTAISGQGGGQVSLSPTAHSEHGTLFIAEGAAAIHGALGNTTYLLQRAIDFSPGDGLCSTDFGTIETISTSPGGAGAKHFERAGPTPGPAGFQFDVTFRVVRQAGDGTPDPSQMLVSDCMTLTIK